MAVSELATSWAKMAARSSADKWTSGTAASKSHNSGAGEVFSAVPRRWTRFGTGFFGSQTSIYSSLSKGCFKVRLPPATTRIATIQRRGKRFCLILNHFESNYGHCVTSQRSTLTYWNVPGQSEVTPSLFCCVFLSPTAANKRLKPYISALLGTDQRQKYFTPFLDLLLEDRMYLRRFSGQEHHSQENPNISADRSGRAVSPRTPG